MKINQISNANVFLNNQTKFCGGGTMGGFWEGKIVDSFEKENEPEKYTQEWAQNWDEDKRKSEIELHCKNEIENLPFFKKKFTNAKNRIYENGQRELEEEKRIAQAILEKGI